MNREERAKQFMPFDALKGLREELKRREEKYLKEKKKELTEEQIEQLSKKVAVLKKGDGVVVTFYYDGHYVELTGVLTGINTAYKYLMVDGAKISFDNIYEIEERGCF